MLLIAAQVMTIENETTYDHYSEMLFLLIKQTVSFSPVFLVLTTQMKYRSVVLVLTWTVLCHFLTLYSSGHLFFYTDIGCA